MPTLKTLSFPQLQAGQKFALTLTVSGLQSNVCLPCRAAQVIATDKEDIVTRVKEITGAFTCLCNACLLVLTCSASDCKLVDYQAHVTNNPLPQQQHHPGSQQIILLAYLW